MTPIVCSILDTTSPAEFTVQKMMEELLVSYALLFRLDKQAQQIYRKEKAKASNRLTDPLLDELCFDTSGDSTIKLLFGLTTLKKESFVLEIWAVA